MTEQPTAAVAVEMTGLKGSETAHSIHASSSSAPAPTNGAANGHAKGDAAHAKGRGTSFANQASALACRA